MTWRWLLCSAVVGSLVPAVANACFPGNSLSGTSPDGGTYPGNAAVVFKGSLVSFNDLTVTVDGAEASLVPAPSPMLLVDYSQSIEPAPLPGQQVHIQGNACPTDCEVDLVYTAGEHDTTPPEPVESVVLSLHDYPDYDNEPGTCYPSYRHTYWLDVTFSAEEELRYMHAELYRPSDPTTLLAEDAFLFEETERTVGFPVWEFGEPADICVRVTAFDRANNLSESRETCGLCLHRTDDTFSDLGAPPSPDWTTEDLVADGTCPDRVLPEPGDSATGGDAEGEGCSCRTGTPDSLAWMVLLPLLGLSRRSRGN